MRTTPSILPNRESGPQNQPSAKVAFSILVGIVASIGGILISSIMLLSSSTILLLLQPSKGVGIESALKIKITNNIAAIFTIPIYDLTIHYISESVCIDMTNVT